MPKNNILPKIKIGTDICNLKRIKSSYEKYGEKFLNQILTPKEKNYVTSNKKLLIERLAGRFAAKEAALKVLGTGLKGAYFKEIEILREESGKPFLALNKRAKQIAKKNNLHNFEVSISHENGFAIAIVVAVSSS